MVVAGVDGTKAGWVAIVLEDGRFQADLLLRPIANELSALDDAAVVAIDIPIGFGPRLADAEARRYLRGAASTVFSTPPREVLELPFGPGLGVSAQAHALGERIRHVTALALSNARLREVHSEVSFRTMNDGRPLRFRKKSAGGALERIELLGRHGIELDPLTETASVPLDDVLDAGAAAWSANRIALSRARSLPSPPETRGGRPVAIWY
jgi:predicted RNase H-like nuclease